MRKKLVLASQSKGRQANLRKLGLAFDVMPADVDETPLPNELPEVLVKRLSQAKAEAVVSLVESNAIVIAGDQVVSCGQTILGKPKNEAEAIKQLNDCSDQVVRVHTGLLVASKATGYQRYHYTEGHGRYRSLTDDWINHYVATQQPFHCAGSLLFESHGFAALSYYHCKDPWAVTGLPLFALVESLLELGLPLPCPVG